MSPLSGRLELFVWDPVDCEAATLDKRGTQTSEVPFDIFSSTDSAAPVSPVCWSKRQELITGKAL